MKKPKVLALVLALFVVVCIIITFCIPKWDSLFVQNPVTVTQGELSVHYLDVGKADCIFITDGETNIVIDSGYASASEYIEEYLDSYNVQTINLLVASHQDKDHIGSMAKIIDKYDVKEFWQPELNEKQIPNTSAYEYMQKALADKEISSLSPEPGTERAYGAINLETLAPSKIYSDINNCSIVIKLTFGEKKFLFMGDAEKQEEKGIINDGFDLSADVIKIGHHGSATSTTQELLDAVQPQIAVISVGPDDNNLPKEVTLDRLEQNNIKTYRTDLNGNVVIKTDGETLNTETER